MLLEAWARVRPIGWHLQIAGPEESGHRKILEEIVRLRGLASDVELIGPVDGVEKSHLFARASLFVLPSYSESFGVAVGEALAEGIPVIATQGSPWSSLISERCGWHVEATVDGLEQGLREAFSHSQEQLKDMGRRGHAYVARSFSWSRVTDEMVELYQSISSVEK